MTTTVARYLASRLASLGIEHVFGVPGNHLGPFLTAVGHTPGIEWIGTPTEVGAGYAADAYARVRPGPRIGAAAVTYSVGAFTLLNPIGGSYVEYVPVVAINATPTYEQWLNYRAIGLLTSHMSQRRESNLDVYRQVTVDAQVVTNAALAPVQIDAALVACLSERRPVYLEVMEDVWDAPCASPVGDLTARTRPVTARNEQVLGRAVDAAVALIEELGRPILWAGEEVDRFDLAGPFGELVEATGIPFCTTIGGKAVLSEDHPYFVGVYNGKSSTPWVYTVFQKWARVRIGIGSWSTSKNLGGERSIGPDWIVAAHDGVSVGASYFPDVRLPAFVEALRDRLVTRFGERHFEADYYARAHEAGLPVPSAYRSTRAVAAGTGLTYDLLFDRVNDLLAASPRTYTVVSDAGFSLLGSMSLHVSEKDGYLAQNSWLSIGYSVGAATGVALVRQDRRPLVFVGDGSFQEVVQELSTHVRHGLRPVIFVLDNEGFYGIEQMLVAPCYYTKPPSSEPDYYNILHPWRYDALAQVFGTATAPMTGVEVASEEDLADLLRRLGDRADSVNYGPVLVHVRLRRDDYPVSISYKVEECAQPEGGR
ncbi:thiamine pyrophosphate-binding protein [Saccharothrix violaceirubra]|uniref:Alpha-keto-acid decarboxylase n=1 Tax=Saccharothrix violaceirubra TaxID=413306 RepID=A0A7W7T0E2_9PSEU|nr:thiamine pyrophosphate-binding protein [Saccharothrix violaceirubra]MBB4964281.1 indolepyruvate decarboxylase [Saccharothrix violaceirubra]